VRKARRFSPTEFFQEFHRGKFPRFSHYLQGQRVARLHSQGDQSWRSADGRPQANTYTEHEHGDEEPEQDLGQRAAHRKIKSLKLKKETVRDLSAEELSRVKGGGQASRTALCGTENR
jgi:natural product precursor